MTAAFDEAGIVQELIRAAGKLAASGFHIGKAGNLSARLPGRNFICTRNGADKENLTPGDFVVCDFEGRKVRGEGKPTSEIAMHRTVYAERPAAGAVIHAHPPHAIAFAASGSRLGEIQLPEMVVILGPVATVPYATPGTEALGLRLGEWVGSADAFLLENHGALTVGSSVEEAAIRMQLLESQAHITWLARALGGGKPLPQGELAVLHQLRSRMFPDAPAQL